MAALSYTVFFDDKDFISLMFDKFLIEFQEYDPLMSHLKLESFY